MSRATATRKALARSLAKNGWTPMVPVPPSRDHYQPDWATRAFRNNHYAVLINDNAKSTMGPVIQAFVSPFNQGRDVFWRDLQRIKNEIFGPESVAIQYFPRESELVDAVNVYWLFVYPVGVLPEYIREGA